MSDQAVRVVWFGVLMVHGLGHFGALAAMAWLAARPGTTTGAWTAARSWLVPSLAPGTATIVASAFWIASLVGFVAAALLFWFGSGDAWQPLAIVSAVVSTLGIVLFFGTWPMFNFIAALGVNAVVLVALTAGSAATDAAATRRASRRRGAATRRSRTSSGRGSRTCAGQGRALAGRGGLTGWTSSRG